MPHAVAHILTPIILLDLYRDHIAKKKFPLGYVMLAGVGGILPDIDVAVYWLINTFSSIALKEVHRMITHTLLVPAIIIIIAAAAYMLSKKATYAMLAVTFGYLTHLLLDYALAGTIMPFYPFSAARYGLNIIPPTEIGSTIIIGIDAIMLTVWLVYDFYKHNIKEFI